MSRRAWDFARENLYDTAAWTEYERTYRDLWHKSLAARPLPPELRAKREAEHTVFPPGYEPSYWQAKAGNGRNLEPLVLFLEADPYVFRSGYAKEATIGALKQVPDIPPHYMSRLRSVILHIFNISKPLVPRREWMVSIGAILISPVISNVAQNQPDVRIRHLHYFNEN